MSISTKTDHALRRRMVLRRPTRSDLDRRTSIVLTDRDQEILFALYQHGFLTTPLIELAFFPPSPQGRTSHRSRTYQRLDVLWRWGYVGRIELPVSRVLGGRLPYLYSLGTRGVPVVEAMVPADAPPVQCRRIDRMVDLFVDHELTIAKLWANLTALLRGTEARWSWCPERLLRGRRLKVSVPGTRWKVPVLPDGAFRVDYQDGKAHCCLVEVDMGTLTRARFRRKLQAFELAREAGLFGWLWGQEEFEVAILTHSAARLASLRAAAREEVPEERWGHYLFATFEALEPARFAGSHWLRLDDDPEPERLLYGLADADEEDA